MLFADIFTWWHSQGWRWILKDSVRLFERWDLIFDPGTILGTLFSPWRQLQTKTLRDSSIGDQLKALLDNLVSRFVGLFIRLTVLAVALIAALGLLLASLARLILWPVIPFLPLIFIVGFFI